MAKKRTRKQSTVNAVIEMDHEYIARVVLLTTPSDRSEFRAIFRDGLIKTEFTPLVPRTNRWLALSEFKDRMLNYFPSF